MTSSLEPLIGARIRRLDSPLPGAFTLELTQKARESVTLLVAIGRRARGVGLLDARPRGRAATSFVRALRPIVEGAHIASFYARGSGNTLAALEIAIERTERKARVVFDFAAENIYLVGDDGLIKMAQREASLRIATPYPRDLPEGAAPYPDRQAEVPDRGAELYANIERAIVEARREALRHACTTARKRLERRRDAVLADASRIDDVPRLRHEANLLVSNLHAHVAGTSALEVLDWALDPPAQRAVPFDPAIGPRRHADALFSRARRMERGLAISLSRLEATEKAIEAIQALEAEIPDANGEDLESIAARATKLGIAGAREAANAGERARRTPSARVPYRRFSAIDGGTIYVGRGAADNDALTTKHARPHDLFLHVRGTSGAHVIVPLDKNASCPPERLVDAATLALHFSSARGEALAEVIYTPRRYVRKPRGAAIGAVTLERETVLLLRLEPERVTRLLASEQAP